MKVDFSQKVTNLNGQPLITEGAECTLKLVACAALLDGGAPNTAPQIKRLRYQVAKRVFQSEGPIDVSDWEMKEIKALIGSHIIPLIMGGALDLLDAPEVHTPIAAVPESAEAPPAA